MRPGLDTMLQKIIRLGIYLIVFSLPLYLVRFKIDWVPVNVLEMMIYGLFGIWLIGLILGGRREQNSRFWFGTGLLLIFLILLGLTIATLYSTDIQVSACIWKGWFMAPLLFFVVAIDYLRTREQIRNTLLALFLSGIGVALIALFYWFNNDLTYDGRLRAFYLSANHLAMYLAPSLILGLGLWRFIRRKWPKILFMFGCFLQISALYLTYSYGAWLGVLAGFAFVFIIMLKRPRPRYFRLIGLALLLVILAFVWQIPGQKFQGFLDLSYPSLKARLAIWQSAWGIIKDHPLIGIGPGMFQQYYLDYQPRFEPYPEWAVPQPHNLFLAFWLQTGLLGLFGFIWLIVQFFKKSRAVAPPLRELSVFLTAAMIYILIHGLVDTPYWKNDLSVIFWLIIALNYRVSRLFG